jgi:hypothetical protein
VTFLDYPVELHERQARILMPVSDVNVIFGKLPEPSKRSGGRTGAARALVEAAEALRANPGEWAQITVKDKIQQAQSMAYGIRKGSSLAFSPKGSFKATVRPAIDAEGHETSGFGVWAMYLGEPDEDDVPDVGPYVDPDLD